MRSPSDRAGLVAAVGSWRGRMAARLVDPLGNEAVRRRAALVLVDDLAAMVAGHRHDEVRAFADVTAGPKGEATLVRAGTRPARASRERAAAGNAVAAAWDEVDEGYRPATAHGGLYALPAALAEAEATGGTLADVLGAVVVGYEVVAGVARLFPAPKPLDLHPHATLSPIGAAAAVTWLRTHSGAAVLDATDVAVTGSMVGPFRHATRGAQVRNLWAGSGAILGFLSADAAAAGLGSDAESLVDVFDVAYRRDVSPDELVGGPDPLRWAVLDGYHKLYAACQYTHAALEASAQLAAEEPVDPDRVEEVVVATHPLALALSDAAPTTALGGKFSVPHVVAAVLGSGRTDAAVFAAAGLHDARTARLRSLVRLEPFEPLPPAPHDRPARVELRLRDGSRRHVVCLSAVGGPDRPLDDAQVLAKVHDLTGEVAPGFVTLAARLVAGEVDPTTPVTEVLDGLLR